MPETRSLRNRVEAAWYRPAHPLLLALSWIHRGVLALRRAVYRCRLLRTAHPGVPTIVVGNVTVGGTGKTPLVIWLAKQLQDCGRRPGIVLRGYGGTQRSAHRVRPEDDAGCVGDEALLLMRSTACPVAVAARRVDAARLLVATGCDVILADDGLQHLALQRDLEILVVDGARGFGNGELLPAGPLRESGSPWRDGRVVVVHGEDVNTVVPTRVPALHMHLAPVALHEVGSGREHALASLDGASVHAVAGIGNPTRFFAMLRQLGAIPVEHPWPDHGRFSPEDLQFPDGLPVVITEKDAVRCGGLAERSDLLFVRVEARLPEADAVTLVARVLATRRK